MKRIAVALVCLFACGAVAYAAKIKSLDDYMVRYFTWSLGANQADHEGTVQFMPIPSGAGPDEDGVYVGEMDVTLKTNQSFFLPIFTFYGETYDDGTPNDDPANHDLIPSEDDFLNSDVLVELDGHVIIDSAHHDLDEFWVSPQYFKHPIVYAAPTDYHSVSAIWVEGLAFLHDPMHKGSHTLHLRITNDFLTDHYGFPGWDNTWHITVKK